MKLPDEIKSSWLRIEVWMFKNPIVGSLAYWVLKILKKIKRIIFSVNVIFSALFFFSTVLLGSVVTILFIFFSTNTIQELAKEKSELVLNGIEKSTTNWLLKGENTMKHMEHFLYSNKDSLDIKFNDSTEIGRKSDDSFTKYLVSLSGMQRKSDFTSIIFGNLEGKLIIVMKRSPETFFIFSRNETNTYPGIKLGVDSCPNPVGKFYSRLIDQKLNYLTDFVLLPVPPYDYRCGEVDNNWFRNTINHTGTYSWTFLTTVTGKLRVLETKLVLGNSSHSKGNWETDLIGVIGVSFGLASFNTFFTELKQYGGNLYLIDQNLGIMIGSSASNVSAIDENGNLFYIKPENSKDVTVQSTYHFLISKFGSLDNFKNTQNPLFFIDSFGTFKLCSIVVVEISELKLIIIYVQDYFDVYGNYILANILSLTTGEGIFIMFTILFIFLIVIVLYLLTTLSKQLDKLKYMKINDIKIGNSIFTEISNLQQNFRLTIDKLRMYRSFFPLSVLKDIEEEALEEENNREEENSFNISIKDITSFQSSHYKYSSDDEISISEDIDSNNCSTETEDQNNNNHLSKNLSKELLMKKKFGIGINKKTHFFIRISFFGVFEEFYLNKGKYFSESFGKLVEYLQKMIKRGTILHISAKEILFLMIFLIYVSIKQFKYKKRYLNY